MGADRRAAVLGQPIRHSLSPVIHSAGYAALGLADWSYAAIECGSAELAELVAGLDPSWRGLSLTMPLKEVALSVASAASDLATTLGAANTLVRLPDLTWRAENTDAPGMVAALRPALPGVALPGVALPGGVGLTGGVDRVAVLGAGGTARAALAAAHALGAAAVTVFARRPAVALAQLSPVAAALGLSLDAQPWESVSAAFDLVISTVPRGVADSVALSWSPRTVLFDALYDPWPTPLAASALAAGCAVVSGLDLLLRQAAIQFELFTGLDAPVDAMHDALLAAAHAR